jgi:cell division protein FtsQ
MWDNPRLLNAAAGFLVGLAALAMAAAGMYWVAHSAFFPVRAVELANALEHAPRAQIEATLARYGRGNFFALPIDELRAALERLPWVRKAAVRRVGPDRVEVLIEEHVALARWGADALVNTYGERFAGTLAGELPQFAGPAGSEAELTRRYEHFSRLLAPLASPVVRLTLSARHTWQLGLANGMELKLGRDGDEAERRLARYVDAYLSAPAEALPLGAVVDLRYPNGFSVRVKG